VTWEFAPLLDAGHRAVLGSGKPLVYVCPPAAWAARPLFAALSPAGEVPSTLVLVPELSHALDLAAALHSQTHLGPVHPVTAVARAQTLLRRGAAGTLIATPPDALDLLRRSAFKAEGLSRVALAWPEDWPGSQASAALDTLLADATQVQRIVLTADESAIGDLLERHARRAAVAWAARLPPAPAGPVRFAAVERPRRLAAARAVLDVLDPESVVLWDPGPDARVRLAELTAQPGVRWLEDGGETAGLCIAMDLPSAEVLAQLRGAARDVVVLLDPIQIPYLQRIAAPATALRLSGPADRAQDQLFQLRRQLRERLAGGVPTAELLALGPLFDEYDPSLVAAALLARSGAPPQAATAEEVPAWVRVHVNAGRRDQLKPGDLVGALLHGVGLTKEDVGRIELREGFALVDVRAVQAERAVAGLNGSTIRGRRLAARIDRR
jgi:hypothetical protein